LDGGGSQIDARPSGLSGRFFSALTGADLVLLRKDLRPVRDSLPQQIAFRS
jgi:hypothetical protein